MNKHLSFVVVVSAYLSAFANNDADIGDNFLDTLDYDSAMTPEAVRRNRQDCQKAGHLTRTLADTTEKKLSFDLKGDAKETIVLVHGAGFDSGAWAGLVKELKNRYRILTFDIASLNAGEGAINSFQDFMDDMHFVTSELGITRYVLIGYSLGTTIAITYAHTFPQELCHLILIQENPPSVFDELVEDDDAEFTTLIIESLTPLSQTDFDTYFF